MKIDKNNHNPPPTQYEVNENSVKWQKFTNITFGRDIKCTQKAIPQTPGPADYKTQQRKTAISNFRRRKGRSRSDLQRTFRKVSTK